MKQVRNFPPINLCWRQWLTLFVMAPDCCFRLSVEIVFKTSLSCFLSATFNGFCICDDMAHNLFVLPFKSPMKNPQIYCFSGGKKILKIWITRRTESADSRNHFMSSHSYCQFKVVFIWRFVPFRTITDSDSERASERLKADACKRYF